MRFAGSVVPSQLNEFFSLCFVLVGVIFRFFDGASKTLGGMFERLTRACARRVFQRLLSNDGVFRDTAPKTEVDVDLDSSNLADFVCFLYKRRISAWPKYPAR